MLSYGYWQRRFGGDRNPRLGAAIQVDAETREIVGVMPRGFKMVDQDFDLLVPLAFDRTNQKLAPFFAEGIGRLKPGVTLAQADADMSRLIPCGWIPGRTVRERIRISTRGGRSPLRFVR
jgi:hypothetical protein